MRYTVETDLYGFKAWAGGHDVWVAVVANRKACALVEDELDALTEEGLLKTETDINDWLWFEAPSFFGGPRNRGVIAHRRLTSQV